MAQQGRLTEWNDDRGFGFITPLDGDSRLFVHVSEFPRQQRRPLVADLVVYTPSSDERGRPRATGVRYLTPTSSRYTAPEAGSVSLAVLVAPAVYFLALAALVLMRWLPAAVLGMSAVLSVVLFVMYGADKSAARRGAWRTPESSLHLGAVFGGWPGALIAQQVFRHKTAKQPFRTVFWITVGLNCIGVAGVAALMAAAG